MSNENEDMIKCEICNEYFVMISASHLKYKHNIGIAEYRENYSKNLFSPEKRKQVIENVKHGHWSTKPKEETQHIRDAVSKTGKLKFEKLNSPGGKAYRCTKETQKKLWENEGYRQKMHEKLFGLKRSDETKKKIKESHWSKKSGDDVRIILEKIFANNGHGQNSFRGYYESKKSDKKMFYMSSYELERFKSLESDDSVLSFTTSHDLRIQYTLNNESHIYVPDIHVILKNGKNIIEEIKGYVNKKDIEKHAQKIKSATEFVNSRSWTYKILYKKDLNKKYD